MDSEDELKTWLQQRRTLERYAVSVLGTRGWSLLRSYGRLMRGPYSGRYVSALSNRETSELVDALVDGEELAVHLMHRHVSGNYESSSLRLEAGRLVMRFPDREEFA